MWKSIAVAVFILALCLVPSQNFQNIDFLKIDYQDLVVHFIMFFVFAVILSMDLSKIKQTNNLKGLRNYTVVLIVLVFAMSTEFLQLILPSLNRSANIGDLFFDFAGSISGIIVTGFIRK